MRIIKFGGSSVENPETIRSVADILKSRKNEQLLIIFSAFKGITNALIASGELAAAGNVKYRQVCQDIRNNHMQVILELVDPVSQDSIQSEVKEMLSEFEELAYGVYLLKELSLKTKDQLQSYGERLSGIIISAYLNGFGLKNTLIDSLRLIKTDENHGNARVLLKETYKNIEDSVSKEYNLIVASGFIGTTEDDVITTLGRGGSDYSAAIYAHALNAEALEKWTDVSGMMTADPRIVKKAEIIRSLSYEEAMELCHFGAKVIYPPTIHPLLEKSIPIIIKNTFSPEDPGTTIDNNEQKNKNAVIGLSSISDIALLTLSGSGMVGIPGFSRRMFTTLSYNKVNINLITQASSEHSITIGIDRADIAKAKKCMDEEFQHDISQGKISPIEVEKDLSIIALVGDNMKFQPGISGKSLHTLGRNGVNIRAIAQGSSEKNISLVISDNDVKKGLRTLHESLFDEGLRRLNLFMVGKGNVGGTLIDQIQKQQGELLKKHNVDIRVIALAGQRNMLFDEDGIDLCGWREKIETGDKMDLSIFCKTMKDFNLHNSIFVDNTAEEKVSDHYAEILKESISVVTSNKVAASSDLERVKNLKYLAKRYNTSFLYETNVGAGLPIIDTIQNLVKSGDVIEEIHAILSGSLTFIFNEFNENTSFTDIVKQAMKEGYTEPDPRIDLSGVDVARKILILAREAGLPLEMKDIQNNKFLPEKLINSGGVQDFLSDLLQEEDAMKSKFSEAKKNGNKLKYVASLVNGKANVGLTVVGDKHPFFNIEGKDNIVLIHTKRYGDQPLVIKGAGAGADVTAMGVFSDIIRLAKD